MTRILLLLLLVVPARGWSQEGEAGAGVSDVSATGADYGGGGATEAGAGSDSYSSGTWSPDPFAGESGGASGVAGGDFVSGLDSNPALYGGKDRGKRIPKFHIVQEGETLWDICKRYYKNPWTWPQLWAENESITNPHWIYPGDKIAMVGYEEAEETPDFPKEVVRISGGGVFKPSAMRLKQHAFVDPEELKKAGVVIGSKVGRIMLSSLDEIYIEGAGEFKPTVGEIYSIYELERPLKDGNRKLGQIVEIIATVRIKHVNEHNVAVGEILDSRNEVERGDRVGPVRRVYNLVPAIPAQRDLTAQIIEPFRPGKLIGQDDLVFLNRGGTDGVRVGNRFLVTRRGDGYRRVHQDRIKDNPRFPRETTAEILVVDVRAESSVGVVTRQSKEIRLFDDVQMRRGY